MHFILWLQSLFCGFKNCGYKLSILFGNCDFNLYSLVCLFWFDIMQAEQCFDCKISHTVVIDVQTIKQINVLSLCYNWNFGETWIRTRKVWSNYFEWISSIETATFSIQTIQNSIYLSHLTHRTKQPVHRQLQNYMLQKFATSHISCSCLNE
jgi:hypothetical protein